MLPNDTPIVAIDVSKGKSHAQGFLCRGSPRGKPFSFDHTKTGFSKLEEAVSALRGETGKEPAVAFEHTGVYSRVVAKWAESAGIRQIAISPLVSAKARKSKLRPTKNDSLDCKSIAEAAYGSVVGEARAPSALLALSRQRESASFAVAEAKSRYRMWIDLCWSCLDAFADPLSNAIMAAVIHYRHPAANHEKLCESASLVVATGMSLLNVYWKKAEATVDRCIVRIHFNSERGAQYLVLEREADGECLTVRDLAFGKYSVTLEEFSGKTQVVSLTVSLDLVDSLQQVRKDLQELRSLMKDGFRAVGPHYVCN